jgi:hypothetical protein
VAFIQEAAQVNQAAANGELTGEVGLPQLSGFAGTIDTPMGWPSCSPVPA